MTIHTDARQVKVEDYYQTLTDRSTKAKKKIADKKLAREQWARATLWAGGAR